MQKLFLSILLSHCLLCLYAQQTVYVSTQGSDLQPGTMAKPLKTLQAAADKAKRMKGPVIISLRGGVYEFSRTVTINASDNHFDSLLIQPHASEKVVFTGSKSVSPKWETYKGGIKKATMSWAVSPDQFFLNGKAQPMARYPNFSPGARVFNGTAADAISPAKTAGWKNPTGGYIHALHQGEWGAFHYRITGKRNDELTYEGGWQNNRPARMHKDHRFVENIFEELDSPGEWYYDTPSGTLYYYPTAEAAQKNAVFTVSMVTDLIHLKGSEQKPVSRISIQNIQFTQTARSFMLVDEPLLRSDWTIYRGGAILIEGAAQVSVSDCDFYELGGNAIFVSGYSRNIIIANNHIHDIGANAIAFAGMPEAVRSPSFRYEKFVPWDSMDYAKGPRSNAYPQHCTASGNLIHHIGTIEKQVAGIQISMASKITAAHNTIYQLPRAGINISEGTWGGHVIEYNDVFNTVLETGDHGAFNSWGRDRFWRPQLQIMDSIVAAKPGIELLDAMDPVVIRNNRFQCDHGWDIDLDDGSTNYQIFNNVCLNGGLKLREGYHRTVTNNILVNNGFHPHVWLKNSGDVFEHNIVTTKYAPILMSHWGRMIDSNYFLSKDGLLAAQALGLDKNGLFGPAGFVDPSVGDYRVREGSPALAAGFKNFDMNFGVDKPALKALAAKPTIRPLMTEEKAGSAAITDWLGATLKNIETLGERSAAGLHDQNGALVLAYSPGSMAEKTGLRKGDVIVRMGDQEIRSTQDLMKTYQSVKWMGQSELIIIRSQTQQKITVFFK